MHRKVSLYDCILYYALSFLLSLSIAVHTEDMYCFTTVIDGDSSRIGGSLSTNFYIIKIEVHIHAKLAFFGHNLEEKGWEL